MPQTPLSLSGKRWRTEKAPSIDPSWSTRQIVDALREQRAIEEGDHPGYAADAFEDFTKAADRVCKALEKRERIAVFGDYDCDGITAACLLLRFFQRRGVQPIVRLPHRLREGYGLQRTHVDEFARAGVQCLITVDTGVTALPAIAACNAQGMDVIVLDHHAPPAQLPAAYALLHPSRSSIPANAWPCGAGIAWSFVEGFERREGVVAWNDRESDCALAAMGTVADVVPLLGGNRTLVQHGLAALNRLEAGPLAFLCLNAGLRKPYTSRDIAFRLAPRINAAGRMADPSIALSALAGNEQALMALNTLNRERQDAVAELVEELMPLAASITAPCICIADARISPGICGLIAGKFCDMFGKPALVASVEGTMCTASLRSIPGYDVAAGLRKLGSLLLGAGGHAQAAGCTFLHADLKQIADALGEDVASSIDTDALVPEVVVDAILSPHHLSLPLCQNLGTLEPFGQGNPEPRFLLHSVPLLRPRPVGTEERHLRAFIGKTKAIGFSLGHFLEHASTPLDLLCRVGIDTWNGRAEAQIFIDDLRVPTPAPVSLPC